MATTPEESLAKMIAGLKGSTGKTLEEWREIIAAKGLQKHGEVVAFLKAEHGLTHGFANQIALRREAPSADAGDPLDAVFAKRAHAEEIYKALMSKLDSFGSDVDAAPKKAYVSLRRKKQFAIAQPAADRLDVGINLPGRGTTARLEASGSFNAMLSHRVRVRSVDELDAELMGWLREAYNAA